MKNKLRYSLFALILSFFSVPSISQDYAFDDFVGTWHGTISAENYGGFNDPITMTIYEDGFYTETSGHLMPSTYPDTQQCEFQSSTNRFHWWYLATVYSGQAFYDHHYYEIVYFNNDTLEMHYNFHDNPEPWPEAGVIYLVRVNTTPSPANFFFDVVDGELLLTWDAPDNGDSPIDVLEGYNVFSSYEQGEYELLAFTEETSFLVENGAIAGLNSYYVTAVYEEEESEPSDQLFILFDTPEPDALLGEPQENKVDLEWSLPDSESGPMATLLGYNVYHKYENEDFAILEFTETINFTHEELDNGTHHYYVTAVYEGGESNPSNEIEVTIMVATSLNEIHFGSFNLYPNPARDHVFINGIEDIKNIRIFNQAGQALKLIDVTGINRKIDISDLSTGLYIITIETSDGMISKRFIVQ